MSELKPTAFESLYPREAKVLMRLFSKGFRFKWHFKLDGTFIQRP